MRGNNRPHRAGRPSAQEVASARRNRPGWTPTWWDSDDLDPCDCPPEERETERLRFTTGYSDFGYGKVRCETCGESWCYWIEG